jgi:hypothetical protein
MKCYLFLGISLLFAAGPAGELRADVLPTGLQLPPRPQTLVAQLPPKGIPAGLPGGPAPVFVPGSRLTLPEKPVLAQNTGESETAPLAPSTSPELPAESPPPLLNPTEPGALPGLLPSAPGLPGGTSDLLPLPDDSAPPSGGAGTPGTPEPSTPGPDSGGVPGSDLSPGPQPSGDSRTAKTNGPIFRIRGAEAFALARQRGFRFTPAQGIGLRDGNHTVASQVPNVLTSEVHGTRMMQMRPSPLWTSPYIENTFYMFCDASYNAVKLQPGWKVRGIQLQGPDWAWVACPRSGANTASFSIRIRSWKRPDAPAQGTVVTLQGLTLEGPAGATDWKAAFPDLNRPAGMGAKR